MVETNASLEARHHEVLETLICVVSLLFVHNVEEECSVANHPPGMECLDEVQHIGYVAGWLIPSGAPDSIDRE